jgi:hypothetical protein
VGCHEVANPNFAMAEENRLSYGTQLASSTRLTRPKWADATVSAMSQLMPGTMLLGSAGPLNHNIEISGRTLAQSLVPLVATACIRGFILSSPPQVVPGFVQAPILFASVHQIVDVAAPRHGCQSVSVDSQPAWFQTNGHQC